MSIYLVSNTGNDSNSGTSTKAPFLTLKKACSVLTNGDALLLDSTSVFEETLNLSGLNSATVGAYGSSSTLPTIGVGASYGLLALNCNDLDIEDLNASGTVYSGFLFAQTQEVTAGNRVNEFNRLRRLQASNWGLQFDNTYNGVGGVYVRPYDNPQQFGLRGWELEDLVIGLCNLPATLNYNAAGIQLNGLVGALTEDVKVNTQNAMGYQSRPFFSNPNAGGNVLLNSVFTNNEGNVTAWGTADVVQRVTVINSKGFGCQLGPQGIARRLHLENLTTSSDGTLYNGFDTNNAPNVTIEDSYVSNVAASAITLEGTTGCSGSIVQRNVFTNPLLTYILTDSLPGTQLIRNRWTPTQSSNTTPFHYNNQYLTMSQFMAALPSA